MTKAVFYHAGCPICVNAEQMLLGYLDPSKVTTEVVHLGEARERIAEAEVAGVQSVPALLLDGNVFHINYGASLEAVKNG